MEVPPRTAERISARFEDAQSRLVLQTSDLPLGTLASMVDAKSIDLEPTFQRRERWSPDKQSALIESFLLNVPVPPIYLSEEPNGTYSAIDGKQRLRSIAEFMGGRLKLTNLEKFKEAEGLDFDSLPQEIRNAFKLRPFLRVVTLLKQTDRTLKFEVFLRLNRGGESLEQQEIRNVAYRGSMNTAIYELALSEFLRKQLKITDEKSNSYRTMADAEYVLRFLTLQEVGKKYSGHLAREMDEFSARHQYAKKLNVDAKKRLFTTALSRCEKLWGDDSFKRWDKTHWRDQLLAGMYDAQMLAVSALSDAAFRKALTRKTTIVRKTKMIFRHEDFDQAVRTGTNTPQRLDFRVNEIAKIIAPR